MKHHISIPSPQRRVPIDREQILRNAISLIAQGTPKIPNFMVYPTNEAFFEVHAAITWLQRTAATAFALFLNQLFKPGSWTLRVEMVNHTLPQDQSGPIHLVHEVHIVSADHTMRMCFHADNLHAGPGQEAAIRAFYHPENVAPFWQDLLAESVKRLCATGFFGNGGAISSENGQIMVTYADPEPVPSNAPSDTQANRDCTPSKPQRAFRFERTILHRHRVGA